MANSENGKEAMPVISSNKQGVAGFVAGFTATAVTYPMDLIKTRFQSSHYAHYKTSMDAIHSIVQRSGMRGLLAGIEASIVGSSLAWGTYFYLYAGIKDRFRSEAQAQLSARQHLYSSLMAGGITQILTNPIWVLKTNLQLSESRSNALWSTAHTIYRSRGWIGFWRGTLPSMFGVIQSSIYFVIYEDIKNRIQHKYNRYMLPLEVIANTFVAKSIAVVLTYPYQVMRTRLQHIGGESQRIVPIMKNVWQSNGIRGFYAGVSINITRIMPATCITFLVYETLKTKL